MEKTYYVYELINTLGTVEYVGMTSRPKERMRSHLNKKCGRGTGSFEKRQDLIMNIVKFLNNKKEALDFEKWLHNYWNLEHASTKISSKLKGRRGEGTVNWGKKGILNPLFGKKSSDTAKKNISLGWKKRKYGKVDGILYTKSELAFKFNCSEQNIKRYKNGTLKNKFNIEFTGEGIHQKGTKVVPDDTINERSF